MGRFRTLQDVADFILEKWPNGPPRNWHMIGEFAVQAAEGGSLDDLEGCLRIMVAHGIGR